MRTLIYLGLAGAIGTLCRYGLGIFTQKVMGSSFFYGTLIINLLGCLIIGFFVQIALNTEIIPPTVKTIFTVGFLGAFTTFSTFSYETVKLIENNAWTAALLNIGCNVGLGIFATFLGIFVGRSILGKI